MWPQALAVLQERIPIKRASMRLLVHVPVGAEEEVLAMLAREEAAVRGVERGASGPGALSAGLGADCVSVDCLVEPGSFRRLTTFVRDALGGAGAVELLATTELAGEAALTEERSAGVAEGVARLAVAEPSSAKGSGGAVARPAVRADSRPAPAGGAVVYPRGPVGGLPEEHASRRERFAELDQLQAGWEVELQARGGDGGTVDAAFYSPEGKFHRSYADARRSALQHSKQQQ